MRGCADRGPAAKIRRVEDAVLAKAAAALEGLRPALERLDALLDGALRRARELRGDDALPHAYRGLVLRAAPSAVAAALGAREVAPALGDWCGLAPPAEPTPLAQAALEPGLVRRLIALAGDPVALIGGDGLQREAAVG